jgi:hypothetical protein
MKWQHCIIPISDAKFLKCDEGQRKKRDITIQGDKRSNFHTHKIPHLGSGNEVNECRGCLSEALLHSVDILVDLNAGLIYFIHAVNTYL